MINLLSANDIIVRCCAKRFWSRIHINSTAKAVLVSSAAISCRHSSDSFWRLLRIYGASLWSEVVHGYSLQHLDVAKNTHQASAGQQTKRSFVMGSPCRTVCHLHSVKTAYHWTLQSGSGRQAVSLMNTHWLHSGAFRDFSTPVKSSDHFSLFCSPFYLPV